MKRLILFLLISVFIVSCSDDDVCIDATTPNFSILFTDANDEPNNLETVRLRRLNDSGETVYDSIFSNTSSIEVSLSAESRSQTNYIITRSSEDNAPQDLLTLNYNAQEQFISKSCGFRLNFSEISEEFMPSAATEIELIQTEIVNNADTILYITYSN